MNQVLLATLTLTHVTTYDLLELLPEAYDYNMYYGINWEDTTTTSSESQASPIPRVLHMPLDCTGGIPRCLRAYCKSHISWLTVYCISRLCIVQLAIELHLGFSKGVASVGKEGNPKISRSCPPAPNISTSGFTESLFFSECSKCPPQNVLCFSGNFLQNHLLILN